MSRCRRVGCVWHVSTMRPAGMVRIEGTDNFVGCSRDGEVAVGAGDWEWLRFSMNRSVQIIHGQESGF